LNIKLTGRPIDTIEVIEAELQAVMNTFTEHDFQDAFQKCQKRWEQYKREEENRFEDDSGQNDRKRLKRTVRKC
jgi:glutamyl-tRNA reductase